MICIKVFHSLLAVGQFLGMWSSLYGNFSKVSKIEKKTSLSKYELVCVIHSECTEEIALPINNWKGSMSRRKNIPWEPPFFRGSC
jgi:hypothetical protein